MIDEIKKLVPRKIKVQVSACLNRENVNLPETTRAFIFLAADYGNIGDLAITAAQESFLSKTLDGYAVIRVPISRTRAQLQSIKKQINANDLVTIVGGGNMGSLYPDIEELRQLVIRSFPENRVICFPQTLDWDASTVSKKAIRRILKVYSGHPDIHVFARESITRDKLGELFSQHPNVNVGFTPDIVLSASGQILGGTDSNEASGILKCLRDDKERSLDAANALRLDRALAVCGEPITVTDTHAGGARLAEDVCANLVADKVNQFRSAKLVVTDRLHGMILSVLAGTPCLVIPNANHKIRQTWLDWLGAQPLVRFMEPAEFNKLTDVLASLLLQPHGDINKPPLDRALFKSLEEALQLS